MSNYDDPWPSDDWLVLCLSEVGSGGLCLWWGPNRSGYSRTLEGAGRYTREEAEKIAETSPAIAVPAYGLKTTTVVQIQDLPDAAKWIRDYRHSQKAHNLEVPQDFLD